MTRYIIIITFVFSLAFTSVSASGVFLDNSEDARGISMGGAFIGDLSDPNAILYNPAGFSKVLKKEMNFSYGLFEDDIMTSSFVLGIPLVYGAMAFSATYFDTDPALGDDLNRYSFGLGYSYPVYEETYFFRRRQIASAGAKIKVISESFMGDRVQVFAVDLGLIYKLPFDRDVSVAAAVKNIGGEYDLAGARKKLPTSMNINISKNNISRGVNIACGAGFLLDEDDAVYRFGGEYNFGREQLDYRDFYIRGGLIFRKNSDTRLSCGAGLEKGDLSIDYGLILGDKDDPTYNIATLGYKFGFIKIEPDDIEKQYKLGEKYYFQGNLLMAQHRFERVLRMSRNYKGAVGYLEKIIKLMGQIKSERPIVESDIEKIRNLMGKADQLLKDEMYREAMKFYVAVLVIDKNNLEARQKLEEVKQILNDIKQEVRVAAKEEKADELDKLLNSYYDRGARYYDDGKFRDALSQYRRGINLVDNKSSWHKKFQKEIVKNKKKLSELYFERGYIYFQQNKLDESVEEFKKALKYDPAYAEAKEKLREVQEKVLQINKKKAERLYEQGMEEYAAENIEKAIELWENVLRFDKDHVEAQKALERVKATKQGED